MIERIGANPLNLRMPQEFPGVSGAGAASPGAAPPAGGSTSFAGTMEKFLGEVNDMQLKAGQAVNGFVRGETADMHSVVMAAQEAAIAARLVTEMRDRLLQSYQEIMRMPV